MECAGISIIEPVEREQVLKLVDRVLADQPTNPGPTRLIEHRIQLTADEPVRQKPRRMAPGVLEAAHRIVDQWKLQDIIERSDSDYSSAPVRVRKPDDTYRMCIDYCDVNSPTVRDAYATPSVDTMLDGLRGARYISKIDLKAAFLQVPMEERSKRFTAFSLPGSGL